MDFSTTVNRDKNGTLLAYICLNVPGINLRKLLKLVYLIDEKFVIIRCFPLTWFSYYAWEKGPVASEVYDIKNGGFSDFVCCKKNKEGQNELSDYTHRKDSLWTKTVSEKHVVFDDGKSNVAIDLDEMNDDEGKKKSIWKLWNICKFVREMLRAKNIIYGYCLRTTSNKYKYSIIT